MKKSLILLLVSLMTANVFAIDGEIKLRKDDSPNDKPGSERTLENVTACLSDGQLSVTFSETTASYVEVSTIDACTVIYNNTYSPDTFVTADLSILQSGEYVLSIYALGYWWTGVFEVE